MTQPSRRRLTPEEEELSGLDDEVFAAVHGMTCEEYDDEQRRFIDEMKLTEYEEELREARSGEGGS